MKTILNLILYGLFGYILAQNGLTVTTISFWLLLGILVLVDAT
jgi:hypothetical protein